MPTYVFLGNMTEKGRTDHRGAEKNRTEIEGFAKSLGGITKDSYTTFGRYDFVEIMELPSDEAALKLSMKGSESGYVRLETLRAFTNEEIGSLLS